MVKVKIDADPEFVSGYLKYGHFEGEVELTEEQFKEFQDNPQEVFKELDLDSECELIIDDFEVYDYGDIDQVNYKVIED